MTFKAIDESGMEYMSKHKSDMDEERVMDNLPYQKDAKSNEQCKQWIYNSTTNANSNCIVSAIAMDKLCLFEELYEALRSLCIQRLTGLQCTQERRNERKSSRNTSSTNRLS
jgi:hypothetical protein